MRSEGERGALGRRLWSGLRSQGLGISCGLATTLLLAIGSFVIAATRGGASAGLVLDDVRWFFGRPSPVHLWFYALLPVLGLYALNTALATWHSVTTKWRDGLRDLRAYAPALFHVGFLVALLAHLVGGLGGRSERLLLDGAWRALPDGRELRLRSVRVERLADGTPRTIRAEVEARDGDTVEPATIAFNEPLSSALGGTLVLLQRPVRLPARAVLESAGARCTLSRGERCTLGGLDVALLELRDGGPHGLLARVAIGDHAGWIARGVPQGVAPGRVLTLAGVESEQGAVVTWRRAPGDPWALLAALLLVAGVGLMGRRLL